MKSLTVEDIRAAVATFKSAMPFWVVCGHRFGGGVLLLKTCNCKMCSEAICERCGHLDPHYIYFLGIEVHYICRECAIREGLLW